MTALRLRLCSGLPAPQSTPRARQFYKLFYSLQTQTPSIARHKSTKPKPSTKATKTYPLTLPTRSLLRQVPHPIAIVTAWTSSPHAVRPSSSPLSTSTSNPPQPALPPPQPTGLTLSSLTSTSLTPPTLSFNISSSIATPSSTLNAVFSTGHFLVHFMLNNEAGRALANAFTRAEPFTSSSLSPFSSSSSSPSSPDSTAVPDKRKKEEIVVQTARTEGLREGGYETRFGPRLGGEGVGAVVGVRWRGDAREVADHVVLWGEIEAVLAMGPRDEQGGGGGPEALCYVGGRYGSVIKSLDGEEDVEEEGEGIVD